MYWEKCYSSISKIKSIYRKNLISEDMLHFSKGIKLNNKFDQFQLISYFNNFIIKFNFFQIKKKTYFHK